MMLPHYNIKEEAHQSQLSKPKNVLNKDVSDVDGQKMDGKSQDGLRIFESVRKSLFNK